MIQNKKNKKNKTPKKYMKFPIFKYAAKTLKSNGLRDTQIVSVTVKILPQILSEVLSDELNSIEFRSEMELFKNSKSTEFNLFKTLYPNLHNLRLEAKVTAITGSDPIVLNCILIGPYIFGYASKPTIEQLLIYTPHYSVSMDKSRSALVFIPICPYFTRKITLFLYGVDSCNEWFTTIRKVRKEILKLIKNQCPPISIIGKYHNLITQKHSSADLNVFNGEITLKEEHEPLIKYHLDKQNIVIITATEADNIPKNAYFQSFSIVFRRPQNLFLECSSLDQFLLGFLSIHINILKFSKKHSYNKWKMAPNFPEKSNQILYMPTKFISQTSAFNCASFVKPEEPNLNKLPLVPPEASTNLELIRINDVQRTILLGKMQPSVSKNNIENEIMEDNKIENESSLEHELNSIRDSIVVPPFPKLSFPEQKSFKPIPSFSYNATPNIMYFRHICSPKLLFECKKYNIKFDNPALPLNGERELCYIKKSKSLSEFSAAVASFVMNGSDPSVLLAHFRSFKKISECVPLHSSGSGFKRLSIFIARLFCAGLLKKFFSLLTSIRTSVYREDAVCYNPLFIEILSETCDMNLPDRTFPNDSVTMLPIATSERIDLLIRPIAQKVIENADSAGNLIYLIVRFFDTKLKQGASVYALMKMASSSPKNDAQRMMDAALKSVENSDMSPRMMFARAALLGLECGQLYAWVLVMGASSDGFYEKDAPCRNIEQLVSVADALFSLNGVFLEIPPQCLEKYKNLLL